MKTPQNPDEESSEPNPPVEWVKRNITGPFADLDLHEKSSIITSWTQVLVVVIAMWIGVRQLRVAAGGFTREQRVAALQYVDEFERSAAAQIDYLVKFGLALNAYAAARDEDKPAVQKRILQDFDQGRISTAIGEVDAALLKIQRCGESGIADEEQVEKAVFWRVSQLRWVTADVVIPPELTQWDGVMTLEFHVNEWFYDHSTFANWFEFNFARHIPLWVYLGVVALILIVGAVAGLIKPIKAVGRFFLPIRDHRRATLAARVSFGLGSVCLVLLTWGSVNYSTDELPPTAGVDSEGRLYLALVLAFLSGVALVQAIRGFRSRSGSSALLLGMASAMGTLVLVVRS